MNQNAYKAAVDSVGFSDSFERDTIERMRRAVEAQMKKEKSMKVHKPLRAVVVAAALFAALALSTLALSLLLSPKEVAAKAGDSTLAKAFESQDAVTIGQSTETGDLTISLLGIVSGKGLTDYCEAADEDTSYIVASVAYTDSREIKDIGEINITFSPLVSGYKPWQVNAWTLGGGRQMFVHDGVAYALFECANLEIFADHTVYLAAFEGNAPSNDIFQMSDGGEISFADGYTKNHALFTLPLDASKASPEAAKALLDAAGVVIE